MFNPRPEILVKYLRGTLVCKENCGFRILANQERVIESTGETGHYPFYLRDCATPLISTLLIDYGMDINYNMTDEEISICCAFHSEEELHKKVEKGLIEKIGLNESLIKYANSTENSNTVKADLFNRSCAGKHIMLQGLCKMNGWELENYLEPEHPIQLKIKERIIDLCKLKHRFPITVDYCGSPCMSMPLENILWGYLSVFTNPRYQKITNAFLNYPNLIGGNDRLDTKIMSYSNNIIAKTGEGGLCVVVNLEKQEGFIVKISDCDKEALEAVVVKSLKNLHWADVPFEFLIKTIYDDVIGEIVVL